MAGMFDGIHNALILVFVLTVLAACIVGVFGTLSVEWLMQNVHLHFHLGGK